MRYQKYIVAFMILHMTLGLHAQELTVKSMETAPMDLSASTHPRLDKNSNPCGLVKVRLAATGAAFAGNVLGEVENHEGEYWVYMSQGSYMLKVRHPEFIAIDVNFRDYGIRCVEPKTTYVLTLQKPQSAISNPSDSTIPVPSSPFETITVDNVQFRMIYVDGGSYKMGSESVFHHESKPIHKVTLSSYSIGETEVTQELWEAVMRENPSDSKGANLPVDNISWNDCQKFIERLNGKTGRKFRLPTEAEWEYAARGGNKSKGFMYSDDGNDFNKVATYAWYGDNSKGKTHSVAQKLPNELDLYDMGGNVWEWCSDWYGVYNRKSQTNPTGQPSGTERVLRGGGWGSFARDCSVVNRIGGAPDKRSPYYGMRLVLP